MRAMQALRPTSAARGSGPARRVAQVSEPVDISEEDYMHAAPPPPVVAPTHIVERVSEAEAILVQMRAALKKRTANADGNSGLAGLARNFRMCDRNQTQRLELDEFAKCVSLCKLELSADQIGKLFAHFDSDRSGSIDFEEFLKTLRGPLSGARKKVVIEAFRGLDAMGNNNGVIDVDDLRGRYDVSKHPDVVAGRVDSGTALRAFLNGFEGRAGDRDGVITLDEWMDYYEEVSASIDNDDAFCAMMATTWSSIKGAHGKPAVCFVAKKELDALEKVIFEFSYRRKGGSSQSQEKLINDAFKLFDENGSGQIDRSEFLKAMERFGVPVRGKGKQGIGGYPESVVMALFDRYDKDGSGSLNFREFSSGLLGRYQESDRGIESDEHKKKDRPTDPEDDSWMRHPLKKHDHELMAARQPSGMSRPGYAGYLSQAVKIHGNKSGGKGQDAGPFKVGRPGM